MGHLLGHQTCQVSSEGTAPGPGAAGSRACVLSDHVTMWGLFPGGEPVAKALALLAGGAPGSPARQLLPEVPVEP